MAARSLRMESRSRGLPEESPPLVKAQSPVSSAAEIATLDRPCSNLVLTDGEAV